MKRLIAVLTLSAILASPAFAEERPIMAKPCSAQIAGAEPAEGEAFAYTMAEMMNTRFDGTPLNAELAEAFAQLRAGQHEKARPVIDAFRSLPTAHRDRDQRRVIWAARLTYDVALHCFPGGVRPQLPEVKDSSLALCFQEQRRLKNPRPGKSCGMAAADWLIGYPEQMFIQQPPVAVYLDDPELPVVFRE